MPEWQGAGVGNAIVGRSLPVAPRWQRAGRARATDHIFIRVTRSSLPHCAALPDGYRKAQRYSAASATRKTMGEALSRLKGGPVRPGTQGKYGGHLRAVQGFAYFGEGATPARGAAPARGANG